MPSDQENIQYLYLVLTIGGTPTIKWEPICEALQLEKGAVKKRWSRLRQAMDKGEEPTRSNYEFLWLLVKHSARDRAYDWDAIATCCNSTKAACSKRYSRLKIAFDKGDAGPSAPGKSAPVTPSKTLRKTKLDAGDDGEGTSITASKRKHTPVKKAGAAKSKPETDEDEDEDEEAVYMKPKRAKSTPKTKPKPTNSFRASDAKETQLLIKDEPVDDSDEVDIFLDDPEQAAPRTGGDVEFDTNEIFPTSPFSEAFTRARELTDVLLNRKSGLSEPYCEELEDMRDVFGKAG